MHHTYYNTASYVSHQAAYNIQRKTYSIHQIPYTTHSASCTMLQRMSSAALGHTMNIKQNTKSFCKTNKSYFAKQKNQPKNLPNDKCCRRKNKVRLSKKHQIKILALHFFSFSSHLADLVDLAKQKS